MSLYRMLTDRREEVLEKCREKVSSVMGSRSSTYQLEKGLPTLYNELLEVFRISLDNDSPETRQQFVSDTITASASRQHAQESFRLGYTVSQLVHGYGCICQGITEFAHETGEPISAAEFSQLNLCLDVAIAQAVSEFETLSLNDASRAESLRLGFLVHELRNYLSSGIMAHELIKQGGVAASGATSSVLTRSFQQMRELIDRAVAGVRMNGEPTVDRERLPVFNVLSEIEGSFLPEANAKQVSLLIDADPKLYMHADRHLIVSAIANLVQNAIKFTKQGGSVWIRAFTDGEQIVIEIEDRCGGIPEGKIESMFTPFVQGHQDRSGLGLGLSIAQRATELNGGELSVRNLPGVGCVFMVRVPAWVAEPVALAE